MGNSSVKERPMDMVVIFMAIHWIHSEATMREFSRLVKGRGRLIIGSYTVPHLRDSDTTQTTWEKIWKVWPDHAYHLTRMHQWAFRNFNSGLNKVYFLVKKWEPGAKRVLINTRGSAAYFNMNSNVPAVVGKGGWSGDIAEAP